MAAPSFERNGFHCLYSIFSPVAPYSSRASNKANRSVHRNLLLSVDSTAGSKVARAQHVLLGRARDVHSLEPTAHSPAPMITYVAPRSPSNLRERLRDLHAHHRDHRDLHARHHGRHAHHHAHRLCHRDRRRDHRLCLRDLRRSHLFHDHYHLEQKSERTRRGARSHHGMQYVLKAILNVLVKTQFTTILSGTQRERAFQRRFIQLASATER